MAFDTGRRVTVLFGGFYFGENFSEPLLGDTWEWNGSTWSLRTTSGPPSRRYAAMAYDTARGVTVLFGGEKSSGSDLNDTWEWDGNSWSIRTIVQPPARRHHAVAYDSARGIIELFGGNSVFGSFTDTWEYGIPCNLCGDLDNDADVDADDFSRFLLTFGLEGGQFGYRACADSDADAAITLVDYQDWLACYRDFVGNPAAPAPQPSDLGDLNADRLLDARDIQPFIDTLLAPSAAGLRARLVADLDASGQLDAADIEPLATRLLQGE
ncbi:MAG TPA: kelch repeat-containing protein [Phycisphaerae bacterium]|nr:kelch repeat-containing protein [Phycisphaerae bacterium]